MQVPNQCNKLEKTKYFCIFNIDAMKMKIKITYKFPHLETSSKPSKQDNETNTTNALIIKQEWDKTKE